MLFVSDFCQLTLDPNTAHHRLSLSEQNRVVTRNERVQRYSDHSERFDRCVQVLSKESVCGRGYWEVEWSSRGYVSISVSYKGINRKQEDIYSKFGHNSQSWSLRCASTLTFWHNNIETKIPGKPPSKIGVHVDHSAGTLSFYRVSDTMTVLHTVHATFTQPIYAGFKVGVNSTVRKMREARISVAQDQFICPVCLDLLKDPVTIPCGHSFCVVCINDCWDQNNQRRIYSCPQCRETFTPRPVLHRNNMLAEVVEKLKKKELQAAFPAHCYAGPGDVECDFCTGRKLKAIKSCLMCQASFCETHLKPHYGIPGLKMHKLVEASTHLQEKICSQHDKLMEIYCRTDQSCICYMCVMHEHRGHDTVSAVAEKIEKQSDLKEEQRKFQQRIKEKEKTVQELKQAVDTLKLSAQSAVEDSERIFTELICSIEKKCCEVRELIRDQEKTELSRAEELLDQLEQEIADLKRRDTEMEQLSHTEDHIHFLQSFPCLCVSSESEDSPSIHIHQHLSFDVVKKSLSDLKERLEEFCMEEFSKISPQETWHFSGK
ncbi:hypothetical protein P4O66_003491 [Electrophorus voltai]|uniref:Tripartite motif-containing protein 16-like n=1 Tax=Electrophorus voltai TaxID=2609070 RepID=A0AAD8YQB0_9TELE|nr:hypothetical protein P4O66_003491 [Electrophorus voltai]